MAQLCIGWLFSCLDLVDDVSQGSEDALVKVCRGTIAKSVHHLSANSLLNKHQCVLLVKKLSQAQDILAFVSRSPISDERTTPALQELHRLLLSAEMLIQSSCVTNSEFLRAAIEQGDMKETFSRLLYDVQWHTIVLQSILMDDPREPRAGFDAALCNGLLHPMDEFSLQMAMKEDEKNLTHRLSSVKLDASVERVQQSCSIVGKDSGDDDLVASPLRLLLLNFQLDQKNYLGGDVLGRGAFGEVHKVSLLGGKYAIKSFDLLHHNESYEEEIAALHRLGHHPNVVSLFGYSRSNEEYFLIMEVMDMGLSEFLKLRRANDDELSAVDAVALMLQVAEGVRFIHSKGMAHRDLKPRKVLLTLTDSSGGSSSRICSAKVAGFGLGKIKDASWTYSNQIVKIGSRTKWMAPEVIRADQSHDPKKADVYSFALICSEILAEEEPCGELQPSETKKKDLQASDRPKSRPNLTEKCPLRLASLIRSCWAEDFRQELRYIKGLLLRGELLNMNTATSTSQQNCNCMIDLAENTNRFISCFLCCTV
jgi:hypothetical protein